MLEYHQDYAVPRHGSSGHEIRYATKFLESTDCYICVTVTKHRYKDGYVTNLDVQTHAPDSLGINTDMQQKYLHTILDYTKKLKSTVVVPLFRRVLWAYWAQIPTCNKNICISFLITPRYSSVIPHSAQLSGHTGHENRYATKASNLYP
ncbi:hypothetical protein BHYA_0013g00740 [Botrytis hyacinthi]|uniref:Uncharacterized protein n=1 Tax=Botrytis hyacinthi TaxID=278943 RepID=A0A4Z1H4V6_9HELO|nr:hypothetical protein BHYA_0013g00740 [Botrytis hyacinthi]